MSALLVTSVLSTPYNLGPPVITMFTALHYAVLDFPHFDPVAL